MVLVSRGLVETRSRARDAIRRGAVRVNGAVERRPGLAVAADAPLAVDDPLSPYVSRGALKLLAALDHFGYAPAGRVALDLGASTGGFSEVLLQRGARRIYAVDVGHNQLHPRLAADERIVCIEGTNARSLDAGLLKERPGALVADLSFISLRLALPPALQLAADDAWLVALVKPQFEAGREAVGKGGIVRDATAAAAAAEAVAAWVGQQDRWQVDGLIPSPIVGGSGNREYLLGAHHV